MTVNLSGKKVLVTGGAGFIGSHTVDMLIDHGAKVVVIDNLSTGLRENLNPEATFYEMNIADDRVGEIVELEKPEIIYNFSFFVLVHKSTENPLLDMDNIIGSLKILQKAKEIGLKKFVYGSSGLLYGNTKNLPATEAEPISPISPYVVAKQAVENYLKFYRSSFGIPYVILRYATVYGPRQRTGAMADYIRKLGQDKQAEIWGDGNKTRDYVFIEDVKKVNLLALEVSDNHKNPVFNVGISRETTLNTLYEKIGKILDKEAKPIYYTDRPGEQMRFCLDNSKIKKELGWEPQFVLDDGLKLTIQYAKEKNFNI